jgi:hypothetical protein
LKTFLEQHMGLRVFYPEISTFYRDVQSGQIEEPLPLDAIEAIVKGVKDHTPSVFETSVQAAIEGSAETGEPVPHPTGSGYLPADTGQPIPPRDPLGEVDQHKASDFTFAGAVNGLWKAFLQGERIHKAVEGWKSAGKTLKPHVNDILDWLNRFLGPDGGGPPTPQQ